MTQTETELESAPTERLAVDESHPTFPRWMNPVLAREVRERMRSPRATVILVICVTALAGTLYLAFRGGVALAETSGLFLPGAITGAAVGRLMFEWVLLLLMALVAFIVPGIAAASVVGERERRTLHLLQVTLLRPLSIAAGKLTSSFAFLFLMLMACAPLFVVCIVLGGVTLQDVGRGFVVLAAAALAQVSVTTYISTVMRRTQSATIVAYLLTFVFTIASLVLPVAENIGMDVPGEGPVSAFVSPLYGMADAVGGDEIPDYAPIPFSALIGFVHGTADEEEEGMFPGEDMAFQAGTPENQFEQFNPRPELPVWQLSTLMSLVVTILFIALTTHRLRLPAPLYFIGKP